MKAFKINHLGTKQPILISAFREKFLANKPQLQPVEINGETYYLRTMTVGDMNRQIFEFLRWLIEQAEIDGVELPCPTFTSNGDDQPGSERQSTRIGGVYAVFSTGVTMSRKQKMTAWLRIWRSGKKLVFHCNSF